MLEVYSKAVSILSHPFFPVCPIDNIENSGIVVKPVCDAVKNLRSAMARNALLALHDMFSNLTTAMSHQAGM